MRRSTIVRLGMVVVLGVAGASCSDDDEPDASPTSSTTTAAESTTTTTISDQEFDELAEGFLGEVEAAGDDLCALVEAATVQFETAAANPHQMEQTINMQTAVLEALASTEPVDEENAERLQVAAARLTDAAEQAGYAPDFLASEEATDVLMGTELQQALTAYSQRAQEECTPRVTG